MNTFTEDKKMLESGGPNDPAQHELWRLENLIEDGMLLDTTNELTEQKSLPAGDQ